VSIDLKEPVSLTFALGYLNSFAKAMCSLSLSRALQKEQQVSTPQSCLHLPTPFLTPASAAARVSHPTTIPHPNITLVPCPCPFFVPRRRRSRCR
jgi:hypothetical protein